MQLSEQGIDLIKGFEKCQLDAYQDSVNIWTIGWGNTFYENNKRVKAGDKLSQKRADELFKHIMQRFVNDVNYLILDIPIKQQQFDALVSFAYNIGSDMNNNGVAEGLGDSTLLKKIKANPDDPSISAEFLKWNKAKGKTLVGLTRRRKAEANLYVTGQLNFFEEMVS